MHPSTLAIRSIRRPGSLPKFRQALCFTSHLSLSSSFFHHTRLPLCSHDWTLAPNSTSCTHPQNSFINVVATSSTGDIVLPHTVYNGGDTSPNRTIQASRFELRSLHESTTSSWSTCRTRTHHHPSDTDQRLALAGTSRVRCVCRDAPPTQYPGRTLISAQAFVHDAEASTASCDSGLWILLSVKLVQLTAPPRNLGDTTVAAGSKWRGLRIDPPSHELLCLSIPTVNPSPPTPSTAPISIASLPGAAFPRATMKTLFTGRTCMQTSGLLLVACAGLCPHAICKPTACPAARVPGVFQIRVATDRGSPSHLRPRERPLSMVQDSR
ncbi:hypothetical protein C8Q74DRAFT_319570 [Fomes fomentarius]|nr:hypothetical protein C8Q74DRAFT_319570 [Fomes fomentarius]